MGGALMEEQPPTPVAPAVWTTLGRWETLGVATAIGVAAGLAGAALSTVVPPVHGFPRSSRHFPWMMPLSMMVMMGAAGLVLAIVRLRGRVDARIPLFLLGWVGGFEIASWIPGVHDAARAILAAGLATVLVRAAMKHPGLLAKVGRFGVGIVWLIVALIALGCFGWFAWQERSIEASLPMAPSGAPNVLLLVLDTVRADHMSLHGYERRTTPELEKRASERGGIVFERAYSSSPWSLPGHAVMFTGRWRHELALGWRQPMATSEKTLAEHLRGLGYDTGGFVGNLAYCVRGTRLDQGFTRYEDVPVTWITGLNSTKLGALGLKLFGERINPLLVRVAPEGRPFVGHQDDCWKTAGDVNREALGWLDGRPDQRRPFFAFLNYFDAHSPYVLPPDGVARFSGGAPKPRDYRTLMPHRAIAPGDMGATEQIVDAYDDLIGYVDGHLGRLMDGLAERGLDENTWVIVTSDHGELLGEHELFGHGKSLFEPLLHVPLVLIPPRGSSSIGPRRVESTVGLRDMAATVCSLTSPGVVPPFPGASLERYFARPEGTGEPAADPILAELGDCRCHNLKRYPQVVPYTFLRAVIDGPSKLIDRFRDPTSEAQYDVAADPGELHDLLNDDAAAEERERLRRLRERLYEGVPSDVLDSLDG